MSEQNGQALAELAIVPKAITAEDLGRIPPAAAGPETSGAAAARAAAEGGAGSSEEPGPSSSAPPPPSGAAALLFFDMVLVLGVQLAAQRSRVPFRECAVLAKLTPDERALLEEFAPYAAPFLGKAGEASPIVGALAFAGVAAMILAGRFRDVRAIAPQVAKPHTVSREAPPAGARPVDVEHKQRWGKVADVVPPGAQVMDSGVFPTPKGAA